MKIPHKILIGESLYQVKQTKFISMSKESIVALINYDKKLIKLKSIKDTRLLEDHFFHEVSHGLLKELEFNHPKISNFRTNEAFIQELGLTLRITFLDLLKSQSV